MRDYHLYAQMLIRLGIILAIITPIVWCLKHP